MARYERRAQNKGFRLIAGIDEAGRGPLAGPVVASAVVIRDFEFTCEINDSKLLTPKKRLLAYREILDKATIGIGLISEDIIDIVNIHNATVMAMEEAVLNLGIEPDILLIDGRLELDLPYSQEHIIGGDRKSISIAAASIIAKVARDTLMLDYHRIYPKYGFDRHKGYGTEFHIKALKRYGPTPLHRKSFKIKK